MGLWGNKGRSCVDSVFDDQVFVYHLKNFHIKWDINLHVVLDRDDVKVASFTFSMNVTENGQVEVDITV